MRNRITGWGACALGMVVWLTGCGGGGGGGGLSYGLTNRTTLAPLGFPAVNPTPGQLDKSLAWPNLAFDRPVYAIGLPDPVAPEQPGWMFVVEQDGTLFVFRNDPGVTAGERHVFLDLSAAAGGPVSRASNEEGLLGLCFDPDFVTNGRFYLHYSAASPRRSVIARFTADLPLAFPPVAQAATQSVILEVAQPFANHNAGMLEFGPDLMLYVSMGDGGSGNDPQGHGQNLGTLLGTMLRIDVRNPPPGQAYGIPADNPFVGVAGAREEIWAYGLRNPWRWSFDAATGDLWLGDVGQSAREEIDRIRKGGNYGWPVYEGIQSHLNPGALPPEAFDQPVWDYGHVGGNTVVGGFVYRGEDLPSLRGAYVYGDYGLNNVWALVHDGQQVISNTQVQTVNQLASFGLDERGEVLAVGLDGSVWRFSEADPAPPPAPFPTLLSQTGLFTDLGALAPAAGLIEYEVNSELWSDGARKRRWIGLPGVSRITFDPTGPWTFPLGTVLVKHFELDLEVGNPASARRIETRVLLREQDGWAGYTYRWNDGQTDAELLPGSLDEAFQIQDPAAPGGQREQVWSYPSGAQCLWCHSHAAGRVLGVRTGQLNRDFDYPTQTDNQLRSWNHIGLFTTDVGAAGGHERWPDPLDPLAGTPAQRARAYLAANCAQCHLPGGPAPGSLDLRYPTPDALMNAIGVVPSQGDLGLFEARIVKPGVKEESVLWERMRRLDATRMPPLGSRLVHAGAVDLVGDWIDD